LKLEPYPYKVAPTFYVLVCTTLLILITQI
jgi:hypothetical protein